MHCEGPAQEQAPAPQLTDEAESLLGVPFFDDPERADALYYNFEQLGPQDIEGRDCVYVQCLRVMAVARREARISGKQLPDYPGVKAWNEKWARENLTVRMLGAMGIAYKDNMNVARDTLQLIKQKEREAYELDEEQLQYVNDVLAELDKPFCVVRRKDRYGELQSYHVRGVIAEAPTGFGKTPILAEVAFRRGIGQIGPDGNRQRMLIVVPSVQLANQLAGFTGDRTFERFAHGLTVTACHATNKDLSGDVIVATTDQYTAYFHDGCFMDVPISLKGFDEVHHITEPLVEETFLNEWRGPTVGITATTNYDSYKDACQVLPRLVSHVDPLESIRLGRTNGAQLFTVLVDCDDLRSTNMTMRERRDEAKRRRDELIIELLEPLWAQGKRSMSFCDPGDKAANAIKMANRISEVRRDDDKTMRAAALHSYYRDRAVQDIIQRYHEGKLDALTTVRTGIESFNAAIDAITFNDITSPLMFRQAIGRGTRLSDEHPITVYIQFVLPPFLYNNAASRSIYEAWGLDRIEQGLILQPGEPHHKREAPSKPQGKDIPGAIDPTIFSDRLKASMQRINFKLTGEVLLDRYERPPEIPKGFIPFDEIPRPENTSASMAKYRLDKAGYAWKGAYQVGWRGMRRWYEQRAQTFFETNPLPPTATDGACSVFMLARAFGISPKTMQRAVRESKTPTIPMIGLSNEGDHVLPDDLPRLEQYMEEEMPFRQPGDIALPQLAAELGVKEAFLYGVATRKHIIAKYRRDPPDTEPEDKQGLQQLLAKDQADTLRKYIKGYERAGADAATKSIVMEDLGTRQSMSDFVKYLTEEEKLWLRPRWMENAAGRLCLLDTWTGEQRKRIEARLRKELQKPLPPHVLPHIATRRLFAVLPETVLRRISTSETLKARIEEYQLGFDSKRKYRCIPWPLLKDFAKYYFESNPNALKIDYDKLPRSIIDKDPGRVAYARYIQAKLVSRDLLGFDPEPYIEKFETA